MPYVSSCRFAIVAAAAEFFSTTMWGSAACPPPAAAGLRPAITSKQAPAPARTIFLIRTVSPPGHLDTGESSSPARKIPAPAWDEAGRGAPLLCSPGAAPPLVQLPSPAGAGP